LTRESQPPEIGHLRSKDGTLDAQMIGWMRECGSAIDSDGELVRIESMPPEEWEGEFLERCGALDMNRVYEDDNTEDDPTWRCSRCGGDKSNYVPVYMVAKLTPTD
jgi:hypothetical protein